MTVKELIVKLQSYDPDLEVYVTWSGGLPGDFSVDVSDWQPEDYEMPEEWINIIGDY